MLEAQGGHRSRGRPHLSRVRRVLAVALRSGARRRAAGRLLPGRGHPADRRGLARGRARALDRPQGPEPDPARAEPLVHRPSAAAPPSRRRRAMSAMGGEAASSGARRAGRAAGRGRRRPRPEMQPRAARMLAAEQAESESGAGLTYTVARPLAVPGDGGPHKTLVARFDADAVLDYLTVPVLAPEAYLRATVTNGTLLLLPGRARIFHGAQFVGETQPGHGRPRRGVRGPAGRGRPDQGRAEAAPPQRRQGPARRDQDDRHRLRDHGREPSRPHATVSVHDHIPVSTDGDVKVRARETSPPRPRPTTSASSPGTWSSPRASRPRSGTGSPSSTRPRSLLPACDQGARGSIARAMAPANRRKGANLGLVGGRGGSG